jgi:hypothetical protein
MKSATLSAEEFIRRFLQHVLPKRFIKVRYYGLLSPSHRPLLKQARTQLGVAEVETESDEDDLASANEKDSAGAEPRQTLCCPKCGSRLIFIEKVPRQTRHSTSREPP